MSAPDEMTEDEAREAWALFRQARCDHCVTPGTVIDGFRPLAVELIAPGEAVVGHDGIEHVVEKSVLHAYAGRVKTLVVRGTLPVTVTGEHEFLTFPALHHKPGRSGWAWRLRAAPAGEQPTWKRADEIQRGDYLVSPIRNFDGPDPPDRWQDPEACWLIGMLAGGGWMSGRDGKTYYLGRVFSRRDDLDRAVSIFRSWGLNTRIVTLEHRWRLFVCSRKVAEEVRSLIGVRSSDKHLPPFVWSDKTRLSATLDGLMAADGTVIDRGRRGVVRRLFTTSLTLAWQAWSASIALGERPFIGKFSRSSGYENAKQAWTVEWSDARLLSTARTEDYYVMPVTRIEDSLYDGPVHDLTVTGSHTFLANGLITHNCGGAHARSCPRVRAITWHENGRVARVEFWPPGRWPDDHVQWPEGLPADPDA
jgi:hypothetical protein